MAETTNGPILKGLSYVFSHEGKTTIAHCLDLDLVASGSTLQEAEERLNTLVLVQIATSFKSGNWSQLKFSAPPEYWHSIETANPLPSGKLEVEVPPVVLPVERYTATLPVSRFEMVEAAAA